MNILKRLCSIALAIVIAGSSICAYAADAETGTGRTAEIRSYVSEGQRNIVLRARQLMELEWTPLYDRYQWGYRGVFTAGTTYTGAPYGQPVYTGYIGFNISLDDFVAAVEDGTSAFYSSYSSYNKIAPSYSMDCSGFVSYSWGLSQRKHTGTIPDISQRLEEKSVEILEVGDCLNNVYSHAVLVSDVVRDASGRVVSIEIMEETPVITRTTRYGEGGSMSLDKLVSYYFNSGYEIYRYPERDSVVYTHSCAVPIDGDHCPNCRESAPYAVAEGLPGSKKVSLFHKNSSAAIYYTLDGSTPGTSSSLYTGSISVTDKAIIKAVAVDSSGKYSRVLTYDASVKQTEKPSYTIESGMYDQQRVSAGSIVALSSNTPGAVIYYTLDGSVPSGESSVYTEPFIVLQDTTIKAFAVANGYSNSDEVEFSFIISKFSSFRDVDESAWYANAVEFAYSRGLFKGTSDTEFSPDATMTRGMFVTVLGRLAGVPSGLTGRIGVSTGDDVNVRSGPGKEHPVIGSVDRNQAYQVYSYEDGWYQISLDGQVGYVIEDYFRAYSGEFVDLNEESYYSPYVQWVYLTGISLGTGNGKFSADESISREDMASLLYNYASSMGLKLDTVNDRSIFSDDWLIHSAKREAVYSLQRAGVINGMGDGSFAPTGSASRAQVAQIYMNFALAAGR